MEDRSRAAPGDPSWGLLWDRAIELLKAYSRVGQSAQRCVTALGILSSKIQAAATLQIQHPGDQGGVEAQDRPDLSGGQVADGQAMGPFAPDGMAFSSDFGDHDFNIDDMFWLNTSAADIFSWENMAF